MNHLAHAWLAGGDAGLEVGGLMGDFVRGTPDETLPDSLRQGIALHRAIDTYTDAHPVVAAARARFEPPWRRYAGIMLDVWFDYCLAHQLRAQGEDLDAFSARLRQRLRAHWPWLPARLQRFSGYMQAHGLPAAYAEPAMLKNVFAGLSQRLSRANPLADAWPQLHAQAPRLEADYRAFFPDLAGFAGDWRRRHAPQTLTLTD
ncbi:ACP phosphodiesterase [Oleiagrimonas sp. C23AA]|uniref:acyl carrier protein phosphodiesterase n=1 Tax=Oleiagrimonas sp. C23AA TaxID=2719047 RepID=UPI001421E546|nr:ACP phosphodiesterase [Oleiagrimonas sp. C23AA]NII11253.1 DUF479 domain-containing protein [Oleiagrimonas sp. C23AA]